MKTHLKGFARTAMQYLTEAGVLREREDALLSDAQDYWEDPSSHGFQANSHWRGERGFPEEAWLELGKPHAALLHQHLLARANSTKLERIIEWGCGGGANAVHLAHDTNEYVGVDVSRFTLIECECRLTEAGHRNFLPIIVDVLEPEASTQQLIGTCDVFLCTYVFELLPSPEYGERILAHAYRLLRPGGFALIQIKYQTGERRTRPRRWKYQRNLANMTTYPIDTFWEISTRIGFIPASVHLRPTDTLVQDERYAYFLLDKQEVPLQAEGPKRADK